MKVGIRATRSSRGPISLGMTSMIDATFLLLSYFLFTTAIAEKESQLSSDVTGVRVEQRLPTLSPQIVDVDSDTAGTLFKIGAHEFRSRDELSALLRRLPREAGIVIRVHPRPDVAAVAAAMQAAHDAGFEKVSYVPSSR